MLGYNSDIFLAKFDLATHNNTRTAPNNTLIIYANPNKGTCNITIPDDLKNSPSLNFNDLQCTRQLNTKTTNTTTAR
jgi:hypothetical protein